MRYLTGFVLYSDVIWCRISIFFQSAESTQQKTILLVAFCGFENRIWLYSPKLFFGRKCLFKYLVKRHRTPRLRNLTHGRILRIQKYLLRHSSSMASPLEKLSALRAPPLCRFSRRHVSRSKAPETASRPFEMSSANRGPAYTSHRGPWFQIFCEMAAFVKIIVRSW